MSQAVKNDLIQLKPNANFLLINHPWYDHFGSRMDQLEAREILKIHPEKKTILFFGLIRDYKGLDLLLDAFSKLDESYQLLIAGEVYSKGDKYIEQINSMTGKNRIYFENRYIPDSEVNLFFSAADVCVLPYKSATQSGITATSFHFEVPMIVTNVGGLKDIVIHNKTGLVIEKPDATLIQIAILDYFDKSLVNTFRENIRSEKEHNSWGNLVDSIIDFSEKI
jgi:glycosyltransferase involved in cell wall biosynthesis